MIKFQNLIVRTIVLKYSGHAMWFELFSRQNLWQISKLDWKKQELQCNLSAIYIGRNQINIKNIAWVNSKARKRGGGFCPPITDMACIPSVFIKTPLIFGESCSMSAFTKDFLGKLRMIELGPRGRWKRSSIFQTSHPSKKVCSQKLTIKGKKDNLFDLSRKKKNQKFWWKLKKCRTFFKIGLILRHMYFDFSAT